MIKVKGCKRTIKRKTGKYSHKKVILDWLLIACSPAAVPEKGAC
jgi:hypothetical protein